VLKPGFNIPYTDRDFYTFVIEAKEIKNLAAILINLKPPIKLAVITR
jgi:hypothetical protein